MKSMVLKLQVMIITGLLLVVGMASADETNINKITPGKKIYSRANLEIFCIERRPNYPRYNPEYKRTIFYDDYLPYKIGYATGLGAGQDSSTKRHPDKGEKVQYIAHIYNMSNKVFNGKIIYQWYFNEKLIKEDICKCIIEPQEKTEISLSLTWQSDWLTEPYPIKFKIISPKIPEGPYGPYLRELVTYTNAMPQHVQVEEDFYDYFKQNTENVTNPTTDSIVQWIQLHMIKFNEMFQEAGTKARINYDIIKLVDNGAPLPPTEERIKYGAFPWAFKLKSESDDWRFGSAYYSKEEDIDYAYLHEVGHQLGLIDLYRLDVGSKGNDVNGEDYRWRDENGKRGLMCIDNCISVHSALALDSWLSYKRGYFGQYLYDIPKENYIKVVGDHGYPLKKAKIKIYQKIETPDRGERVPNIPKFSGYTDDKGLFYLPNVKINESLTPKTATGNKLRPNPFGYVSFLGNNGLFLVEIRKSNEVFYEWLPIPKFNNAYWRGNKNKAEYLIKIDLKQWRKIKLKSIREADPSIGAKELYSLGENYEMNERYDLAIREYQKNSR